MLFSSGIFWIFFLIVITFIEFNFRFIRSIKFQNLLLLFSSYFFYGYWDYRFLGLIIVVSLQTYIASHLIYNYLNYKKLILITSIFINLSILIYFKYANFFASEFLHTFDLDKNFNLENIILPVGISFYIFQSFTYVLDIFSKKIEPEKDLIKYFTFVAFFPQLVAGPIERASELLPQFKKLKRITFNNLYTGIKIIITGLFYKIFIADNLAGFVDSIFSNYINLNSGDLLLGAIGFSIQIYGDFSGYSLIAIGIAKIMDFSLMRNFNTPYFSISIQDFWRRWHISLSSFFRDYLYIPLGGSRISELITNRNLLITFIVSGLWHGANWTFIFWGLLHGSIIIIQRILPISINRFIGWIITMFLVLLLWILFRSDSINDFYNYINIMIYNPGPPNEGKLILIYATYSFLLDTVLLFYREQGKKWFNSITLETFTLAFMFIIVIGTIQDKSQNFIYFQF